MKICTICETEKELKHFYKQKRKRASGEDYFYYNPECKECSKNRATKWQKDNPEKHKKIKKKFYSSPKEKMRLYHYNKKRMESGKLRDWQQRNTEKVRGYNAKRQNKIHKISLKEWNHCKEYFNYQCAYCGMDEIEHKKIFKQQLHKEHVIHEGRDDIKNCIPSCKPCNGSKHTKTLNQWFNKENPKYSRERYLKIYQWIRYDCKTIKQ